MVINAKPRGGCTVRQQAKGIKKPSVRKLERFLSAEEISRLAIALEAEAETTGNPYPSAAIKLLLLTGARRGEITDYSGRTLILVESACGCRTVRRAQKSYFSTILR